MCQTDGVKITLTFIEEKLSMAVEDYGESELRTHRNRDYRYASEASPFLNSLSPN
jgi:hypothetical protein